MPSALSLRKLEAWWNRFLAYPRKIPGGDWSSLPYKPFQLAVESHKISLDSSFLQAKHPQLTKPLLTGFVLKTLNQFHCPSPDTPQHLTLCLGMRGLNQNTEFQDWPHQCQVQGKLKRTQKKPIKWSSWSEENWCFKKLNRKQQEHPEQKFCYLCLTPDTERSHLSSNKLLL